MASRRSGRRGKGGRGLATLAGGALLIGAGAAAYFYVSDSKVSQAAATVAEIVPDVSKMISSREEKPAEPASVQEPAGLAVVDSAISEAEGALALEGRELEAGLRAGYAALCPLLEGPLPLADRERALRVFHEITRRLFLGPEHNEFNDNYTVRHGDSFAVIAHRAGISINLLYDLNNRERGSRMIHAGDNLKLPRGRPCIVARKGDYTASLYFGDKLVRQYVIAHGRGDNTPEGQTAIKDMVKDPEKSSRGARDPVNEMRLRWIGLEAYADARSGKPDKRTGFGFHGTIYPDSIGRMESRGCIRMRDADVIELYDICREGNKVEIRA